MIEAARFDDLLPPGFSSWDALADELRSEPETIASTIAALYARNPCLMRFSRLDPKIEIALEGRASAPIGKIIGDRIQGCRSDRDKFDAIAQLFHEDLKIEYDEIPPGAKRFFVLAENRIRPTPGTPPAESGGYPPDKVLKGRKGLCLEKVGLLRSMLGLAGVFSAVNIVGAPDGQAASFGTHATLAVHLDGEWVNLDIDRAWSDESKKWKAIDPKDLFDIAKERHAPHRDVKRTNDKELYGINHSNTGSFRHLYSIVQKDLQPAERAALVSEGRSSMREAMAAAPTFVEVPSAMALGHLARAKQAADVLSGGSPLAVGLLAAFGPGPVGELRDSIRDLGKMVGSLLNPEDRWKPHEQAALLTLLAEGVYLEAQALGGLPGNGEGALLLSSIGQRIEAAMKAAEIPFTFEAQVSDATELAKHLAVESDEFSVA